MPIGKVDSVPGIVGNSYYKDPLTNYAQSFREFTKGNLTKEIYEEVISEDNKKFSQNRRN